MIQEKVYNSSNDSNIGSLLKNVLIITLAAALFLILVGRFGGNISDKLTKSSCNAINETYVAGKKAGEGMCIKSSGNVDIRK